jgi:predicted RNA binding protein YcfA (HicA-like mRNA interferase family)
VPSLKCTFGELIEVILRNGFVLHRQSGTSHAIYRREQGGEVRRVVVEAHGLKEEIKPDTLQSMIRQSGLPKRLFENELRRLSRPVPLPI